MARINSTNDDRLPPRSKSGKTAPLRPDELGRRVKPRAIRKIKELDVQAVRKQVPLTRRIARSLLNEESKDIGSYILYDILIPAAKSMITESIQSGIEMLIYGETGQRRRPSQSRSGTSVSYGSFYQRNNDRRDERPQKRFSNARFNIDEIVFKNGSDCSDVLAALCDHIEEYEAVSVAEFYDYAGVEGATHTDHKWGWTGSELSDAYCTHTRGGYVIVLPEPKELE